MRSETEKAASSKVLSNSMRFAPTRFFNLPFCQTGLSAKFQLNATEVLHFSGERPLRRQSTDQLAL